MLSMTNHLLSDESFNFRHQMITSDDTIDATARNLSRKVTYRHNRADTKDTRHKQEHKRAHIDTITEGETNQTSN